MTGLAFESELVTAGSCEVDVRWLDVSMSAKARSGLATRKDDAAQRLRQRYSNLGIVPPDVEIEERRC
jgi:hypothetical protein